MIYLAQQISTNEENIRSLRRGNQKHHLKLVPFPQRILVIEDDLDTAELISQFIMSKRPDVKVEIVSDPYKASLRLMDEHFDLVLADQNLPGLKGTSVIKQVDNLTDIDPLCVNQNSKNPIIPVVLMSGSKKVLEDLKEESLRNFEVIKKVSKDELQSFLAKLIMN